ncbi:hypothetical protein D5018_10305 [Parashewanella curva]|uniref:Death domain-containing protein n=1 Tax=Parashewanella curva TaxID=2338552 RepID=A0A3L8PYU3_9GAMM|nr:death domain-containing protein [Parashewanella curva]RLV59753.1 hypothetical protein D5018_10305 [Parashewanella curva]
MLALLVVNHLMVHLGMESRVSSVQPTQGFPQAATQSSAKPDVNIIAYFTQSKDPSWCCDWQKMATCLMLASTVSLISREHQTEDERIKALLNRWVEKPDANIKKLISVLEEIGNRRLALQFKEQLEVDPHYFDLKMDDRTNPDTASQVTTQAYRALQDENQRLQQQLQSIQSELQRAQDESRALKQQVEQLTQAAKAMEQQTEEAKQQLLHSNKQLISALKKHDQQSHLTYPTPFHQTARYGSKTTKLHLTPNQEFTFRLNFLSKIPVDRINNLVKRYQLFSANGQQFIDALGVESIKNEIGVAHLSYNSDAYNYHTIITKLYEKCGSSFTVYDFVYALAQAKGGASTAISMEFITDIEKLLR